jgi:hypothetical protein
VEEKGDKVAIGWAPPIAASNAWDACCADEQEEARRVSPGGFQAFSFVNASRATGRLIKKISKEGMNNCTTTSIQSHALRNNVLSLINDGYLLCLYMCIHNEMSHDFCLPCTKSRQACIYQNEMSPSVASKQLPTTYKQKSKMHS